MRGYEEFLRLLTPQGDLLLLPAIAKAVDAFVLAGKNNPRHHTFSSRTCHCPLVLIAELPAVTIGNLSPVQRGVRVSRTGGAPRPWVNR